MDPLRCFVIGIRKATGSSVVGTPMSTLPDPDTDFGRRVRERLTDERIIWWTTVSADGTPQPNPVWFVWDGADQVVVYNTPVAHRLNHIAARPQVSLHFNADHSGGDVVVLKGLAEPAPDQPPNDAWTPYLDKYAPAMRDISGTERAFAQAYSVPVRIRLLGVRGF